MNNEMTNVYNIIKREFPEEIKHFGLQDNRELAAFLHYNAHNEMFVGTDEYYYHNVNFKNLDTGRESRFFCEGGLYFFPKLNDQIKTDNYMKVLKVGHVVNSIIINENGLFTEQTDLKGNIMTKYYDIAALNEISKKGLSAGNIDHIDSYIQEMGIFPDVHIMARKDKENGKYKISIRENGENINEVEFPLDETRTLYSLYYEYMKLNNYYGNNLEQQKTSGMNR